MILNELSETATTPFGPHTGTRLHLVSYPHNHFHWETGVKTRGQQSSSVLSSIVNVYMNILYPYNHSIRRSVKVEPVKYRMCACKRTINGKQLFAKWSESKELFRREFVLICVCAVITFSLLCLSSEMVHAGILVHTRVLVGPHWVVNGHCGALYFTFYCTWRFAALRRGRRVFVCFVRRVCFGKKQMCWRRSPPTPKFKKPFHAFFHSCTIFCNLRLNDGQACCSWS